MGVGAWYGLNRRLGKYGLNHRLDISLTTSTLWVSWRLLWIEYEFAATRGRNSLSSRSKAKSKLQILPLGYDYHSRLLYTCAS